MSQKKILLGLLCLLLLYPVLMFFQLERSMELNTDLTRVKQMIANYQVSIWISWVVFAAVSVFHKWTQKKNFFFIFTYCFLAIAFTIFGFYLRSALNQFNIEAGEEENFSSFTAFFNFVVSAMLTGFLQASTWWFTRRWHRR